MLQNTEEIITDTSQINFENSFKKQNLSNSPKHSKSHKDYRHRTNGYRDVSEKLERLSCIFQEKMSYIEHKSQKEKSIIRIRKKSSADSRHYRKNLNLSCHKTEKIEPRKTSYDFYKTMYPVLGTKNKADYFQDSNNKEFSIQDTINRDTYFNFKPANEIKMLFIKSGETKQKKKDPINIPHSKFSQTFKSNPKSNVDKNLDDYGDHQKTMQDPTDLQNRTNFVGDMIKAERSLRLSKLKCKKDVSYLKDRDKRLLENFGTEEFKADYLPERSFTTAQLKENLTKSDFKMINLDYMITFDDEDNINDKIQTKLLKEQSKKLKDDILVDEQKSFVNRPKIEKIPNSRVEVIELGKWFAERVLSLHSFPTSKDESPQLAYKNYSESFTILISYMIKELIKQNYILCQERGELLGAVWVCMVSAFDQGYRFMKKIIQKSREFAKENLAKLMANKDAYTKNLLTEIEELKAANNNLKVNQQTKEREITILQNKYTTEKRNAFVTRERLRTLEKTFETVENFNGTISEILRRIQENRAGSSYMSDNDMLNIQFKDLNEASGELDTHTTLIKQIYESNEKYNENLEMDVKNIINNQTWDTDIIKTYDQCFQTELPAEIIIAMDKRTQTDDIYEAYFEQKNNAIDLKEKEESYLELGVHKEESYLSLNKPQVNLSSRGLFSAGLDITSKSNLKTPISNLKARHTVNQSTFSITPSLQNPMPIIPENETLFKFDIEHINNKKKLIAKSEKSSSNSNEDITKQKSNENFKRTSTLNPFCNYKKKNSIVNEVGDILSLDDKEIQRKSTVLSFRNLTGVESIESKRFMELKEDLSQSKSQKSKPKNSNSKTEPSESKTETLNSKTEPSQSILTNN